MARQVVFITALMTLFFLVFTAEAETFDKTRCLVCHEEKNPEIVSDWQTGSHANASPVVGCVACHGDDHDKSASHARRNDACTSCHGGEQGEVVKSYRISKHGVIARLEENRWQWSQPLLDGNYRAPSCAYCHVYDGNHALSSKSGDRDHLQDPTPEQFENATEQRITPCLDCHSPRFANTWFTSGEQMIALGRMKVREAAAVEDKIQQEKDVETSKQAKNLLANMNKKHLRNIRLGVFHQSPDHQWWHGHPALDGDLLRMKGLLGDLLRRRAVE